MQSQKIDPKDLPQNDFEWYGEPSDDTEPREIPDEPPLGELHEDDWAWLLVYKYYEWLKIVRESDLPSDERHPERWEETFAYVKANQGQPRSEWKGDMPWFAVKYVNLNKRLTEAQRDYLQQVATGEIYPDFPDPADEAEAHRGRGPLY